MDAEELDLTIIEATDEYRPAHENDPRTVASHDAGAAARVAVSTPPAAEGAEPSLLESRVAQLEADVESWQRRTIMWRERALSAQALNEALNTNLEDLRTALRALAAGPPHAPEAGAPDVSAGRTPARQQPPSATVVEWCNRVFRRDFWTGSR
jgi:hypothetical protein